MKQNTTHGQYYTTFGVFWIFSGKDKYLIRTLQKANKTFWNKFLKPNQSK